LLLAGFAWQSPVGVWPCVEDGPTTAPVCSTVYPLWPSVRDAASRQATPMPASRLRIAPLRPQAFTHGLGDVARAGHAARAGGGVNTRQQGLIHRQVHADDPAEHLHRDQDMRHGDTMTLVPVNVG
jgi:hypothetical protein